MNSDPASLNVSITLTGLHVNEVAAPLSALPDGVTYNGSTVQPALGTARHTISVQGLSVHRATRLLQTLEQHLNAVAQTGQEG